MTEPDPLSIALTGDSILQRRLHARTDPVVKPLFDLVQAADVAFTNLEVLPNDYRGDPALESGGSHFGAPAWVVDELVDAGFDLFAFATNHSLDYGIAGLRHALDALGARGVLHAGCGLNLEEARRPAYLTHPKGTVAMLSCSATFAKGQEASGQRPDMPGRPGLSPLRHSVVHEVTPVQLAQLRAIAEQLGFERKKAQLLQSGFVFPPDDPTIFTFDSLQFREAADPGVRTTAKAEDLAGMARWVREAREMADVVLVSLHAHEQDGDKETPAAFLVEFAHRMIDEGASMVVGHGPHLLRGLEMYRGCPIFYSLGNFIGQNELVPRLPQDSYDRFRAPAEMTPGQVYRKRTDDDRKGFPADPRYWESVMPVCRFVDGRLTGIDITPVTLGLGEKRYLRGRPRLAEGAQGRAILERFAALSGAFGTRLALPETDTDGMVATLPMPKR